MENFSEFQPQTLSFKRYSRIVEKLMYFRPAIILIPIICQLLEDITCNIGYIADSHDFDKADGNYTLFYLYTGVLLPEMVTSMVLLQLKAPGVIHASRSVPVLEEILDILDTYNKLAPGLDRDDKEDLAWPGVWSKWEGS